MPHFPSKQGASRSVMPLIDETQEDDQELRIRTKNRRMRYLSLHPEYFEQSHLELPDPLLYDRFVRRFLNTEEREQQGREKGYSGVLEANLVRSEAKVEALQHPDPNNPMVYTRATDGSIIGVEQNAEERATSRADGWEKWKEVMGLRFIRGDDSDFNYDTVDANDDYDDRLEEERKQLEGYLDSEKAEFLGEGKPTGETGVLDY